MGSGAGECGLGELRGVTGGVEQKEMEAEIGARFV